MQLSGGRLAPAIVVRGALHPASGMCTASPPPRGAAQAEGRDSRKQEQDRRSSRGKAAARRSPVLRELRKLGVARRAHERPRRHHRAQRAADGPSGLRGLGRAGGACQPSRQSSEQGGWGRARWLLSRLRIPPLAASKAAVPCHSHEDAVGAGALDALEGQHRRQQHDALEKGRLHARGKAVGNGCGVVGNSYGPLLWLAMSSSLGMHGLTCSSLAAAKHTDAHRYLQKH